MYENISINVMDILVLHIFKSNSQGIYYNEKLMFNTQWFTSVLMMTFKGYKVFNED